MRHSIIALTGLAAGFWLWQRNRHRQNALPVRNKVVILTGASAGIGEATAHAFAKQGAHVVLIARRAEKLADVQADLAQYGHKTTVIPADVTVPEDRERIIQKTLDSFGRIDVLVNNAGLAMGGWLEDIDPARLQKMVDVNLTAAIQLTQQVLPTMKQQHSGHIVNVSSVAGLVLSPGQNAYAATKAGLNGFSDAIRREVRDWNISVSVVCPGWTDTDMIAQMDRKRMRRAGMIEPLIVYDKPETIADAIVQTVQQPRNYTLLGGIMFKAGDAWQRLSPASMDFWTRFYFHTRELVELEADLGTA